MDTDCLLNLFCEEFGNSCLTVQDLQGKYIISVKTEVSKIANDMATVFCYGEHSQETPEQRVFDSFEDIDKPSLLKKLLINLTIAEETATHNGLQILKRYNYNPKEKIPLLKFYRENI